MRTETLRSRAARAGRPATEIHIELMARPPAELSPGERRRLWAVAMELLEPTPFPLMTAEPSRTRRRRTPRPNLFAFS